MVESRSRHDLKECWRRRYFREGDQMEWSDSWKKSMVILSDSGILRFFHQRKPKGRTNNFPDPLLVYSPPDWKHGSKQAISRTFIWNPLFSFKNSCESSILPLVYFMLTLFPFSLFPAAHISSRICNHTHMFLCIFLNNSKIYVSCASIFNLWEWYLLRISFRDFTFFLLTLCT